MPQSVNLFPSDTDAPSFIFLAGAAANRGPAWSLALDSRASWVVGSPSAAYLRDLAQKATELAERVEASS